MTELKMNDMQKLMIIMTVFVLWNCQKNDAPVLPEIQVETFTDARDQTTYRCITIGDQVWMAENLRYKLRGGAFDGCWTWKESLPKLKTGDFVNLAMDYWAQGQISMDLYDEIETMYFDDATYQEIIDRLGDRIPDALIADFYKTNPDKAFLEQYGYLYDYEAAKAAIPSGWRLPTDEDWQKLEQALGMSVYESGLLNEWRGNMEGEYLKKSDEGIGFDALLAGGKVYGTGKKVSVYTRQELNAYFWSSTVYADTDSTTVAVARGVGKFEKGVLRFTTRLDNTAYSVRCVKNKND